MMAPAEVEAIIAGIDGLCWEIHVRDQGIVDLIWDYLRNAERLKVERLLNGRADSPEWRRPRH